MNDADAHQISQTSHIAMFLPKILNQTLQAITN
jgi:hypothetical protein